MIAGVVVVLIMLGAGVYVGTDLLRQGTPQGCASIDAPVHAAAPEVPQADTAHLRARLKKVIFGNLFNRRPPAATSVQVEPRAPAPPAPAQPVAPKRSAPPPLADARPWQLTGPCRRYPAQA
jgi:hypothetical protein